MLTSAADPIAAHGAEELRVSACKTALSRLWRGRNRRRPICCPGAHGRGSGRGRNGQVKARLAARARARCLAQEKPHRDEPGEQPEAHKHNPRGWTVVKVRRSKPGVRAAVRNTRPRCRVQRDKMWPYRLLGDSDAVVLISHPAPAATEAMLDDEDDDASGPSILLRAAAEMIVDEAERDSHIDAAEALLRLIPTVDVETSIMGTGGEGEEPANEVGAGGSGPVVGEPDAGPSPGGELPRRHKAMTSPRRTPPPAAVACSFSSPSASSPAAAAVAAAAAAAARAAGCAAGA